MNILRKVKSTLLKNQPIISHGKKGINEVGHRRYIGGMWDEIGTLQYDFLTNQGLKPEHVFLDIACGSLRLGVKLIPFLEPGNYLGIDKEETLIDSGIQEEIGPALNEKKHPSFVVSTSFEFEKFNKKPDFAIAQSLFTHLPSSIINQCFSKLRSFTKKDFIFFATYFESIDRVKNRNKPHDHARFYYSKDEIRNFGDSNGFHCEYIGNWNHPRSQIIVKYTPN